MRDKYPGSNVHMLDSVFFFAALGVIPSAHIADEVSSHSPDTVKFNALTYFAVFVGM